MDKKIISGEFVKPDGGSVLMDLEEFRAAIKMLTGRTKMADFATVEDLGLTRAEATWDSIRKALPFNSTLTITMVGGDHPNLDSPRRWDTNGYMSGTMVITGNRFANGRMIGQFFSEQGMWVRFFSDAYATGNPHRDTGWMQIDVFGQDQQINSTGAASIGGKITNITVPGQYFIAGGTLNSDFTDHPFPSGSAVASNIEVRQAYNDRGVTFTLKTNAGPVREWRNFKYANGTVSGWVPVMVGNVSNDWAYDIKCNHVSPRTPAGYNLGGATLEWKDCYLRNAPTVLSDRRYKTMFEDIPDAVLDAISDLKYQSWKMAEAVKEKGADVARRHFGVVAQDVEEAFSKHGLNAFDYGILIYEKVTSGGEPVIGEDGLPTGELTPVTEEDRWMVRMEEIFALEAALQRRTASRLEERLKALEGK